MRDWWAAISLRGLRVQILLWTILPLTLLLIAFSLTGVRSHQRSMRTLVAERDAGLVKALSDDVAIMLDRYLTGVQLLANPDFLYIGGPNTTNEALRKAGQRLDGMTPLVVANEGQIAIGPSQLPAWTEEATQRIVTASTSPDTRFTLVLADGRTLLFGAPLDDRSGWLVGGLPIEVLPLARLFNASYRGVKGSIVLVDQDGRILYARGRSVPDATISNESGFAQALAGESGVLFEPGPQGEQVVAYAPIAGADWALVLQEPWEALAAPLLRIDRVMPFVLVTAAVASLLTLFFGLRFVVRPLHRLDAQAKRIGQGDFEAAAEPIGGVQEIEELRRTLDRMARQVQRHQAALEDYLGALTQAQEEERARLARELHDETVQSLVALSQRTQMAQRELDRDPQRAAERLSEMRAMIALAVEEVRRFSRALRPLYLEELGLVPALEMLAREADAAFRVTGRTRRLTPDQELALYRIAQEALSNSQRHAHARHIDVSLAFHENEAILKVRDDGTGFPVPDRFTDLTRHGHFGLLGMHERAQQAGGRLTIASTAGRGTLVQARLSDERQAASPHQ